MSCLKGLLHNVSAAVAVLVVAVFAGFLVQRSSQQLRREWHVIGGYHVLASLGMLGAITTAIIVGWIVITMVRP